MKRAKDYKLGALNSAVENLAPGRPEALFIISAIIGKFLWKDSAPTDAVSWMVCSALS